MTLADTFSETHVTRKTHVGDFRMKWIEYDPFGGLISSWGTESTNNSFRFSTHYHDNETGLVYAKQRYYSSQLGRFISRDPLDEFLLFAELADQGRSLNDLYRNYTYGEGVPSAPYQQHQLAMAVPRQDGVYSFVRNNAVNGVDPWGLFSVMLMVNVDFFCDGCRDCDLEQVDQWIERHTKVFNGLSDLIESGGQLSMFGDPRITKEADTTGYRSSAYEAAPQCIKTCVDSIEKSVWRQFADGWKMFIIGYARMERGRTKALLRCLKGTKSVCGSKCCTERLVRQEMMEPTIL